jgi:nucleotide-binding universal stress UspA family protein
MKWILGLDLRPLSHGALRFATWLAANAPPAETARVIPVHVLEEDHLRAVLRHHHFDEIVAAARQEAKRIVERDGRADWIDDLQIVQALRPEESLELARASAGADGILIGRAAGRHERRVVRLGRIARRLLRALPSPVVVVPPDLQGSDLGAGPIVVVTSLRDDALDASRFAITLARHAGRKVALAHVVGDPAEGGLQLIAGGALARVRAERVREGERELAAWVASARLQPDATAVLAGNVIDKAVEFAEAERSPLLVVGARRRAGIDRVLVPSIGRELAATAAIPVAVVPAGG